MYKLNIYDSKNGDRFLGTLQLSSVQPSGYVRIAVLTSLHLKWHDPAQASVRDTPTYVEFSSEWRRETIAKSAILRTTEERLVLLTSAPLSDLMKLDDFALPNGTYPARAREYRPIY